MSQGDAPSSGQPAAPKKRGPKPKVKSTKGKAGAAPMAKDSPRKVTGKAAGKVGRPRKHTPVSKQVEPGLDPVLHTAMVAHLRGALLPNGEAAGSVDWLDEAARFVLAAAQEREAGQARIHVTSAREDRLLLRLAIINDDMPFLVDTVAAILAQAGLVIDRLVHPVISVLRDAKGQLLAISDKEALEDSADAAGAARESIIYIETDRVDARQRRELERTLAAGLADVRAAVHDWPQMVEMLRRDADTLADPEGGELLHWFADGNLTVLGHVTRTREGEEREALGLCRVREGEPSAPLLSKDSYARAFAAFDALLAQAAEQEDSSASQNTPAANVPGPMVIKANRKSTVHRRVPMDLFLVPVLSGSGDQVQVTALSVHAGLWTSAALATKPERVPHLRGLLARLSQRLGLDPAGHTGKALAHALTSLPHDLVLGLPQGDVERLALTMTGLVDRPRPRLLLARSPLMRHVFAFVWIPRDLLSTQVQSRVQTLIESAIQGQTLDWSLQVDADNLALLRYTLDVRGRAKRASGSEEPELDEAGLDHALQVLLRGWREAVEASLAQTWDAGRAAAMAGRYAEAFPLAYRSDFGPAEAALDIAHLRKLSAGESGKQGRDVRLHRHKDDAEGQLRLKIYQSQGSLPLSDAVPALENFGFRVLGETATVLDKGRLGTIHDFLLETGRQGQPVGDVMALSGVIEAALRDVLNGEGENDPFNGLVPALGLAGGQVNWLRAWYRYIRQAGTQYGITTVVDALLNAPHVTLGILDMFRALHDPAFKGSRAKARESAESAIAQGLAAVTAINDDRVLRTFRDVVLAMLRTNAFAPAGEVALAFKFDSARVPGLPKPLPWREIFVYSQRVEGIHLRTGPVARGGLRWSDRRDDFRTEVLGLMKAQRVKNAVIVPSGAKGGFYPKQLPDPAKDRVAWAQEGRGAYEVFVDTLLSVTDNIVGESVAHPASVRVLDGEDPYFVVAADKGTATFSDLANGIAQARDFWLDDAFASGGSNGYDHKAMGITAKGAWLSVQRHFLEMGIDVQTDPVRVVGCGDMSGDVFGNGMLLSRALKLVAAFDHRHIFLDPDPDPQAAWAERQRLFALPVSSWGDYDKTLISQGGGVFPRSLKAIPLSEEVQAALGITAKEMDPDSLISAILQAPVDLLWFGGIGTYVKASAENNVQVGDPANDVLRVNGADIRARVIGEGANLGVTQAGRIEFAAKGGRINADFIDNSAGVDCSDKEVNIKIALAAAKRAGKLTEKKRVQVLHAMTDAVSVLVLEDNRLQALALSVAERGGAAAMPAYIRLIETMQDRGALDPRTEGLASADILQRRGVDGQGLTRPELAVLLSSSKLVIQEAIENSDLPRDPDMQPLLFSAFPEVMQESFAPFIRGHRLAHAIIATQLANRMVNRLGPVIPFELAEEEGVDLAQVAAAFTMAERLFGLSPLWAKIEQEAMSESARLALFERTAHAVRSHMAELLRVGMARSDGHLVPSQLAEHLEQGIAALAKDTVDLLGERTLAQSQRLRADLTDFGAPVDVAARVGLVFDLDGAVGVAALAADIGIPARRLVYAFAHIGQVLGVDWAQGAAAMMTPSDPWERLLVAGLARDFQQMRLEFLRKLVQGKSAKADPLSAVQSWTQDHAEAIRLFGLSMARAERALPVTPAILAQLASQARNVLTR